MAKLTDAREIIRELADLLDKSSLSEIEVEDEEIRIRVARQPAMVTAHVPPHPPPPPTPAEAAAPESADAAERAAHPGTVPSPMVGTVYVAPEPGAPAFVKVGDRIEEGQTLLIVEAMKVMNPIPAPKAGTVIEILVSDAQPVEYDEPLMIVE